MTRLYDQADRASLLAGAFGPVLGFRKRARIAAVRLLEDCVVETDRGPMTAVAGDWLVTNHPDDDPGSDLWSISAERMAATYEAAARLMP
jgi:hypothetical protein